jgi:hypothetical protein
MITGKKNAPSLAVRGKSTFSEGGGDKWCEQKSTHAGNCSGVSVALQQVKCVILQNSGKESSVNPFTIAAKRQT